MMQNLTTSGPITHRPRGYVFRVLDELPPLTRRAVHEAVVALDPVDVAVNVVHLVDLGFSLEEADRRCCQLVRSMDDFEVREFAAKAGGSAHVAACATIQRYATERRW
jgi:hypothetical protein